MKQTRSNKKTTILKAVSAGRTTQSRSGIVAGRNGRVGSASKKAGVTDDIQYVLPLGNGWVIKASNSTTFTAITDSKAEAISIARTLARTKHTHLIVHGKDGTVEIRENYLSQN